MATFANCRFDATSQKYMTVWYTNDASPVLDELNKPEFLRRFGSFYRRFRLGKLWWGAARVAKQALLVAIFVPPSARAELTRAGRFRSRTSRRDARGRERTF